MTLAERKKRGYGTAEMIIYAAIVAIIMVLIGFMVGSIVQASTTIKLNKNLISSATTVIQRILIETRNATNINMLDSIFNATPGKLKLNTTNSGGSPTTVEFYVEGNIVKIKEGAAAGVVLMPSGTTINSLMFRQISTGKSQGLKIEAQFQSTVRGKTKIENYYTTVILRGSYQG